MNSSAMPLLEARIQERRRHQRVKVVLPGRYMLEDRREYPCRTVDISPGGVAFAGLAKGRIGERVVAYLAPDRSGRGNRHAPFRRGLRDPDEAAGPQAGKACRSAHLARQPAGARHGRRPPARAHHAALFACDAQNARRPRISRQTGRYFRFRRGARGGGPAADRLLRGRRRNRRADRPSFRGGIAVEFNRPFPVDTFDENVKL